MTKEINIKSHGELLINESNKSIAYFFKETEVSENLILNNVEFYCVKVEDHTSNIVSALPIEFETFGIEIGILVKGENITIKNLVMAFGNNYKVIDLYRSKPVITRSMDPNFPDHLFLKYNIVTTDSFYREMLSYYHSDNSMAVSVKAII